MRDSYYFFMKYLAFDPWNHQYFKKKIMAALKFERSHLLPCLNFKFIGEKIIDFLVKMRKSTYFLGRLIKLF